MSLPKTSLSNPPAYVEGHNLLRGKRVIITAAAGTGIGYAAAKRCAEEGATILISDIHEGRLADAAGFAPGTTRCRFEQAGVNLFSIATR